MIEKLSIRLAKKSLNATLVALEMYNKPDSRYREETFCILMINAYEILFKAKLLFDNNEKMNSLYIYENKKGKKDKVLKQKIIKRNRIKVPYTIDINKCMNLLHSKGLISNNLKENLNVLIEIRDNAIHFINKSNSIKEKLYSICAASVKNYVKILQEWFNNISIKKYNFFVTPLNFDTALRNYEAISKNTAENNLLNYLELITNTSNENDKYDILVNVDIKFSKNNSNNSNEAILLKYASDGRKINIELNDEVFKKMYPFSNQEIIKKIKEKQNNFKQDKYFNIIKKRLQKDEICCKARYLDVVNKNGKPRYYYNGNFVNKVLEIYNDNLEKRNVLNEKSVI